MKYLLLLLLLPNIVLADAIKNTCRSAKVRYAFNKLNNYPHGRKGYVIDHICSLECGGLDSVVNMQYQTYEESKLKDKWERTESGCFKTCNPQNSTFPVRHVFNCSSKTDSKRLQATK